MSPRRITSLFAVATVLIVLSARPSIVFAQGDDALDRIEALEKENQELRAIIEQMQSRLADIEDSGSIEKKPKKEKNENADTESKASTEPKEEKDEEKEDDGKKPPWLLSIEDEYFKLGGRLRFGYFDVQSEDAFPSAMPENPGGTFFLNEFRLQVEADFADNIRFLSKFDAVHEDGESELVEAYVDFNDLWLSSELRFGLQPAFWRPSRHTRSFPLAGRAFWQDRDIGIQWKADWEPFVIYAGVSNGLSIDDDTIGEDDSGPIIGSDNNELDIDDSRELSLGAGYNLDLNDWGDFDLLAFGVFGNISDDDVSFLRTSVPGYGISDRDARRWWGVNLEYDIGEWDFFSQAITARDGELDRFAWYVEGSYEFDVKGVKYIDKVRPLLRYSSLDTGLEALPFSFGGSLTWDRQQWMIALITELADNVHFHAEYAWNLEETGGPDADNNELLLLLELEF